MVEETEFVRLNTVIRPSKEIIDLAINLSNLPDNKSLATFVLDDINYYPHVTLYAPEYPKLNIDLVYSEVKNVVSLVEPLNLVGGKLSLEHDGTITIIFNDTQELLNLKSKITESLSPRRGGRIRKKFQSLEKFTEEEKNEIAAYGYPISEYQFPHLSLIHFIDYKEAEKAFERIKKVVVEIPDSVVDTIAVCNTGRQGTCVSIEKEFKISDKQL